MEETRFARGRCWSGPADFAGPRGLLSSARLADVGAAEKRDFGRGPEAGTPPGSAALVSMQRLADRGPGSPRDLEPASPRLGQRGGEAPQRLVASDAWGAELRKAQQSPRPRPQNRRPGSDRRRARFLEDLEGERLLESRVFEGARVGEHIEGALRRKLRHLEPQRRRRPSTIRSRRAAYRRSTIARERRLAVRERGEPRRAGQSGWRR